MTITSDAPADTTMMRIVHDALPTRPRQGELRRSPGLSGQARSSGGPSARTSTWMMRFLHAHHASEDDGLYPLVRERAGAAAEMLDVLDRMARQHEAIAPAMAAVETAAMALAANGSDDATQQTTAALDALAAVLLPHLQEEEDDAMPIAARLITAAEWQAIEKQHNLDPKSMSELGFEGHWLIDSASDADRATVIGLVPPVQRFILLHGFARRYRRHAAACWTQGAKPPRRVQLENSVAVTVEADIDDVWDVVRDVTRVGEWSHECVGAELARWVRISRSPAHGFGAATAPASSAGDECARSCPPSRTSSCGAPSPPPCTPTAPSGGSPSTRSTAARGSRSSSACCAHRRCSRCSTPWPSPPTVIAPPR